MPLGVNMPEEEANDKIRVEVKTDEPQEEKKPSRSPWVYSTVILAVIAIAMFGLQMSGITVTGNIAAQDAQNTMSADDAGQRGLDFVNTFLLSGATATLDSISESGYGLYELTIDIQGTKYASYITEDGKLLFPTGHDIDEVSSQAQQAPEPPAPVDISKSDRPVVELFIWSYCPYGVQAQGSLSEVASLLGGNADFEAVLYHDGHGAYETQQNKIQACIQEVAKDKFWEYAASFVETIYPKCGATRDIECDKTESVELMKSLGIDDSEVMSCVNDRGEDLIAGHVARAINYGITGSPSLVINGLKVNTARNSEAFKAAVCEAFNEAPEECGETLSSSSNAASGNC